jgi:large subunit ribosomal protein L35
LPKMKTIKGAAKRFKPTATGKLKREHALFNHILTKKSANRKRRLSQSTLVTTKGDIKRIKRMLGI